MIPSAAEMPRLDVSITPTALSEAAECGRIYAFKRWLKWFPFPDQPPNQAAEKGNVFHSYCEDWNRDGTLPAPTAPHQELFQAILPWAPRVKSGESEGWLNLQDPQGRTFGAKADWFGSNADVPRFPALMDPTQVIPVGLDYKSSSAPDKWGLTTRDAFLTDPQAVIVGTALARKRNASIIGLRWLYTRTKGQPKGTPQDAVVTRDELEQGFAALQPLGDRVYQIRSRVSTPNDALALPAPDDKESVCEHRFGKRCEYYYVCYPESINMALPQTPWPLNAPPSNGVAPQQPQQQQPPQQQYAPPPQVQYAPQQPAPQAPGVAGGPLAQQLAGQYPQAQHVGMNPPEVQQQIQYAPPAQQAQQAQYAAQAATVTTPEQAQLQSQYDGNFAEDEITNAIRVLVRVFLSR